MSGVERDETYNQVDNINLLQIVISLCETKRNKKIRDFLVNNLINYEIC